MRKAKQINKLVIHDSPNRNDSTYVWEENTGWEVAIGKKLRRLSQDEVEELNHQLYDLGDPPQGFLSAIKDKTFGLGKGEFTCVEDYYNALKEWFAKGEVLTNCD